jgi:hypothetical protein
MEERDEGEDEDAPGHKDIRWICSGLPQNHCGSG